MSKVLRVLICLGVFFNCSVNYIHAQAPVANFSASATTACAPALITFTDLSTNSPSTWEWNLGNSTIAINQNPSTSYTAPGTYTVSLKVTNASGTDTKTMVSYITIVPAPIVGFTGTDTAISCAPKTVVFTNSSNPNSSGNATYLWDFGDGSFSNQVNPSHTYTTSGTYNVSLVVTNGAGCTNVLNRSSYVRVAPKPTSNFTATNNNSCSAPVTATFTNTSTGATSYYWEFGDGGTSTAASPTHNYTTSGSFTVKLVTTNSNGCKDTLIRPAYANIGTLATSFTTSTTNTCTNTPVSFTNTTTPGAGSSLWYFGDGNTSTQTNPVYSYPNAGTYTVKLVVNNGGCKDSTTRTITITQGPVLQFTNSYPLGCSTPLTVNFTNGSTGAVSYLWLFGDGGTSTAASPSHTYTSYGQFTVTMIGTSANGCVDTVVKQNLVKISPLTGNLTVFPTTGCAPVAVHAIATYTSVVPIASINWTFGDGGTDTGVSPTHIYTTPGLYTINAVITSTAGCSYPLSMPVQIGSHLTPSFTASPTSICLGQAVVFTNTTPGTTSNTTYTWFFGDGGTSTLQSPTIFYGNFGLFSPMLIVNNLGCIDTIVRPNLITVTPPLADFETRMNCTDRRTVTFINKSIGTITNYSWDFGDGSPLFTGPNPPPHVYPALPADTTYLVRLIVSNGVCLHVKEQPIHIFPLIPDFVASPSTMCTNVPTVFYGTMHPRYETYMWYFGNGNTYLTISNTVSYQYPHTGVYSPKVVITDVNGCKDSITKLNYITVNGINAGFTANMVKGCSPVTITFTDTSTFTSPIATRVWDFGDGNSISAAGTTITHTYATPGTYTVTLTLTDVSGCPATLTKPGFIRINRPVASYTASSTDFCLGGNVSFTNNSTGLAPLSYAWSFGDATSSTLLNPSHLYTAIGAFNARLIVTDSAGCKDTMTRVINVSHVTASFTMSDTVGFCPPLNVSFNNTSTGGSSFYWDFGNGSNSTSFNPSNVYSLPGVYTVRLVVVNPTGCSDTFRRVVRVNNGATGTFTYGPLTGCYPLTVTFTATTQNASAVTFDFNNGNTVTTTNGTTTYTYTSPGLYLPVMVLSSGPGCNTSIVGGDTIRINRVYAGFSATPNSVCLGTSIHFTDTSKVIGGTITTRNWAFGDGNFDNTANPNHTYAVPGTYTVRLISGTSTGCKDTAFRTVVINPIPVITVQDKSICIGGSVALPATGATTYNWSPATGLSCTSCPTPVASPTTTTTYTVTGTNAFGCPASTTVTVTVNPLPSTLNAGPNQTICAGGSANLNATGASTYTWVADPTLSCLNCANPTATPLVTTTYFVTGNSTAGCSSGASVTVFVNPKPTITTSNKTHCAGKSDTLAASGGISYVWSPATGLSCTACPNPVATPAATTTYTVTGTDANGCSNTATAIVTVNPNPTINITGNTNICIGGTASLTASGAVSYVWTPAATLSCGNCASPTANPTTTTTYTVTGTNAFGCTGSTTVTVTVNPLPSTLSAGPNQSICAGTTATLAATGASSYVWNASPTLSCTNCAGPVASPTTTTTYCVTGTSTAGCSSSACVTVTVMPLPVIATINKAHCAGKSDTLAATGGVSYVWSPATGLSCTACPNPVATPATTTTYTVTGTGANGCINTATSTVTVNPIPTITIAGATNICQSLGTTLTASGAATYVWSPATGLSCTNCASPVAAPTTTTTYTVQGTSAAGCVGTTTVTINVNTPPNVTAGPDQSTCLGTPVGLSAAGALTYVWTPATGLSCTNCPAPMASPATTTTYIVTGTDAAGCKDTGIVTVTIKPLPVISAGNDTAVCRAASVQLQATGGTNYIWSPATGLSCTNCPNPVATPTGVMTYTVSATGTNGCVNTDDVTVSLYPQPVINAGPDQTICSGRSALLEATGGNTYVWSPAATLSCVNCQGPVATPPATAVYKVIGTDIHGCNDSDEVTITVIQRDPISVGPGGEICEGESFQLTASGGTGYIWMPASTLNNAHIWNPVATPNQTTTYKVVVLQGQCFSDTLSATVVVHPLPSVNAGNDRNIMAGGSTVIQTTGTNIKTYRWSPDDGLSCVDCATPTATPTKTTKYAVHVTSEYGCESGDDVTVFVTCDQKQLWLPNTFTPNGDGQNDRFYPHGKGITSVTRFRVYDRWGEVIYDVSNMPTDDPNYGWDGTYKNQQLKPDVYVYYINAKCSTGEALEIKGDITLVR